MKLFSGALLVLSVAPLAFAQTPIIRATLEPQTGVIAGQPVRLTVTVLVPNYFTGSPDFPVFELENAIVVLQGANQNTNAQINGVTYAGIQQTYFIYPQQPGNYTLPPAQIGISYANNPPQATKANLSLPPLTFLANIPAEARGLSYFLPTTQLTMQQKWDHSLKDLHAGDTIERTITITAAKTQAMLIPPLTLTAPDGIRTYTEEPNLQEQKTPYGEFLFGRRIQSVKYFIVKEGDYTLPALKLEWWNLTSKRLITAQLPAVHFTAAPNENSAGALPPELETVIVAQAKPISFWKKYRHWIFTGVQTIAIGCFVLWLGWRYLPRIQRRLETLRSIRQDSEPIYFRNLQRACSQNNATESYRWLLAWLARRQGHTSLENYLKDAGDPELMHEIDRLGKTLFSSNNHLEWNGKRLSLLLKRHRKFQNLASIPSTALPKLNL